VPVAQHMIRFDLAGPGKIIGVGNGDPGCHEPDTFVPQMRARTVALNSWRWQQVGYEAGGGPRPDYAVGFDDSGWSTLAGENEVWTHTINRDDVTAVYRARFTLTGEDLQGGGAQVRFSGCDDEGWYFVNGQYLGETHDWNAAPAYEISKFLRPGDNVIAVLCRNGGSQGGLNPNVSVDLALPSKPVQWSRSLFNGLAQVIIQSSKDAGEIRLTAVAAGLAPTTTTVNTLPSASRPFVP